MNVLIDFHHSDLMESLYRLFEDRLGFTVYVPRGLEWFTAGIWRFGQGYPDGGEGVARQFLLAADRDGLQPEREIHWVTYAQAQEMDWDVAVATVPDNERGYSGFAREHGARYVVEVGNVAQWVDRNLGPLILDSTAKYGGLQFTPEFDLEGAFRYRPPVGHYTVGSFVNLFPRLPCYPTFDETQRHLGDWWSSVIHGHDGFDGFLVPTAKLGERMAACDFIWHDKISGDGFGYVIHYAAAVGRPLIGHASHYAGQRAEFLWDDLVTSIDLGKHSPAEVASLMDEIVNDPPRHREMCETIAERVRERIHWLAEAERVRDALNIGRPSGSSSQVLVPAGAP